MSEDNETKSLTAYCSKQYAVTNEKWKVRWSRKVEKALSSYPSHIRHKFFAWVTVVRLLGLLEARKRPGYHDEPLKGVRIGQRSVRINKAYRIIYVEFRDGEIQIIEVIEVTKHAY